MPELTDNNMQEINTVTLTDEEGIEREFEVLDSIEYDEEEYFALTPLFDAEPEKLLQDTGALVILHNVDDGGEQYLEEIDDDDLYDAVADIFMERLGDRFDFIDEDDDEDEDGDFDEDDGLEDTEE